ncbi:hypothetical protein OHT20_31685 [Streptomyces caniferus]|uniref:hypothetical protein n=1 Tax=Streptomyces caniferus TaxID=285557 RepID=UPI002E2E12C6|nr:hypothetical protein [Streptomyces caniferus]
MSGGPVDPADVPVFTGDLDVLEAKTKALSHGGSKVQTAGSDVHKSFGGLSAFYKAPEAEQLFGVTKPVERTAHDLSDDMHVIAGALSTYAREIRPLIHRLQQLKQEAADFRDNEAAEDDWSEDGDLTDENLNRRNKIAEVWAAFQEAERDCHAKIVALVGGKALHTIDASHKKGYGYDAEALKASKSLPWGEAVEESVPWWHVGEHAYDFGKGFIVDGVGGTIDGIYTLFGGHGSEAAGQAWTNLAKLGTALSITMTPAGQAYWMVPSGWLPPWLRESRDTMVEAGKGFVAWDQWESNGSRAAGAVTFNIVTAVFTRGGGAAVQGAGKAGALAKSLSVVSKVGSAVDPMTYVIKGAGAGLSKVGDGLAHLKGLGRVEAPKISEGAYSLPEGAVEMSDGTVQLPEGAAVPEGATKLPGGRIKLPEGTVTLPPHTVKDPFTGNFTDAAGHLYSKDDGSLLQDAKDAPQGNPAQPASGADNPRIETPARQEQRVPAGVGGRGDDFTRVGSDVPDPAHTGDNVGHGSTRPSDNTPTGRASDHSAPGSNAGNHMPTNNLDNSPTGGGSRTADTTPTTGGGYRGTPSSGGGRDLPGGSTADNGLTGGSTADDGIPSSSHPEPPSLDALDDAARARGSVGDNAGDDAATPAGDNSADGAPAPHQSVPRPEFMLDGPNPYGPRGRLTLEQIEEIQVYRANHEPGYFKDYYKGGDHLGDRKSLELKDESGLNPPQLTRLSDDGLFIRAKDAPQPPQPHFLDADYIRLEADAVTSSSRLKTLHEAALDRHLGIQWDKIVEDWKAETGKAHEAHNTLETGGLWAEAKGAYKESHTQMGDLAEKFGEKAAEHHFIAEHYPDFEKQTLLGPKNGNDQFDQVWKHEDGRVVVIEAKSSTGTNLGPRTLPNGRRVSQGSREYFFDIIRMMEKRGEFDVVRDLKRALTDGKLEYVVVRGERNAGRYTGLQYRRFDISKGTLP